MTYSNVERRAGGIRLSLNTGAVLISLILAGCDGGFSTQEAMVRCDAEQKAKPTVTDEAYQACITCFEECGDDCEAQDTSPETYACDD